MSLSLRVDLNCKDAHGRQIIIEIQNQREADYLQRLLWGTSKAVVESLELGKAYKEVVKVISISILYHNYHACPCLACTNRGMKNHYGSIFHPYMRLDETKNTDFIYYGATELVGWHTQKPLVLHGVVAKGERSPVVTSREVFPEYYMIYVEKFQDMINEDIDEWVYFFKHGTVREDFKSPGIQLAARKLDYLLMNEAERPAYENYLAYLGQELSIIDTAKEEGRQEEKKEVAFKALEKGFSPETVVELTGLTLETVLKLSRQ